MLVCGRFLVCPVFISGLSACFLWGARVPAGIVPKQLFIKGDIPVIVGTSGSVFVLSLCAVPSCARSCVWLLLVSNLGLSACCFLTGAPGSPWVLFPSSLFHDGGYPYQRNCQPCFRFCSDVRVFPIWFQHCYLIAKDILHR